MRKREILARLGMEGLDLLAIGSPGIEIPRQRWPCLRADPADLSIMNNALHQKNMLNEVQNSS